MDEYRATRHGYIVVDTQDRVRKNHLALEVQKDPYEYLLTEWEGQWARMLPLRLAFAGAAVGASTLYYISRHHEINRLRRLKISFDLLFNVGGRAVLAGFAGELVARKLFINYDRIQQDKCARNEIKKVMRTFPDAKPHLLPH